jgi:hypothetical protein
MSLMASLLAVLWLAQGPPAARIHVDFVPEQETYAAAAREYAEIWAADGAKMIEALEAASGLRFDESAIRASIIEGPSSSGFRDIPMRLRASYPPATKRATLMHELGHRLQNRFFSQRNEDHPYLFLYLYDAWVRLYGQAFADEQVAVESARKGLVDYESIWKATLALTPAQRAARWREFLRSRGAA